MASALLRDWQLELLEKLIEAEARLASRGERDEFVAFLVGNDTEIQHKGLPEPLKCAEGDVRALSTAGAIRINSTGNVTWMFDLAPGTAALVESERAARGTPRPSDELASLRSKVASDAARRRGNLRALAEWFAEPVRWLVFLLLAVLAGAVAGASFLATDNPAAPITALIVVGVIWGLLERLVGIHVVGLAATVHRRVADRIESWLNYRLERPTE